MEPGPGELTIDVATSDDATIVSIAGELDLATAPKLRSVLAEVTESGPKAIRIDLGGVTFLDSSAISVLVEAQQRHQADGVGLVLHGLLGHSRRVLEIAGLTDYFELSDEPILDA